MATTPQVSLLRQQLFDKTHQIQLLKQQNQHLLSQLAQSRQKQQSLKKLNDMLVEGMGKGEGKVNDQITLRIEGDFLSMRVVQLEQELERYRSGVSDSVDRRVRKIVGEYIGDKELEEERQRSRLGVANTISDNSGNIRSGNSNNSKVSPSTTPTNTNNNNNSNNPHHYHQTHSHKYYNIHYNTFSQPTPTTSNTPSSILLNSQQSDTSILQPFQINIKTKGICLRCQQMLAQLQEKDGIIEQLQRQLEQWVRRQQVKFGEAKGMGKDNDGYQERNDQLQRRNSQLEEEIQQCNTNYHQLYRQYQLLLAHNTQSHNTNTQSHNTTTKINHLQPQPQPHHYTITHSPISGFKKKHTYPSQLPSRQEQMLQEITNLVNGMGRGKRDKEGTSVMKNDSNYDRRQYYQQQQTYTAKLNAQNNGNKSRLSYGASRVSTNSRISQQPPRLDCSKFTIKQGVNRHGNNNIF